MIAYLLILLSGVVGTFAFLPFYVIAQKARDAGTIPPAVFPLVIALLLVGGICDIVLLNIPASVIFLDLPWQQSKGHREITFSQRLKRLVRMQNWRGSFARWVAATFILWIDPDHLD